MAFKMKYSNGGFPYKSPLKDNKLTKEQWEKDKENLPGSYWDDKTNSMKIKPTIIKFLYFNNFILSLSPLYEPNISDTEPYLKLS